MNKLAFDIGALSALGSGAKNALVSALGWNPALTSSLLGAGAGALVAGEGRRVRGAGAGALGGLLGGLAGAGLKPGTVTSGQPWGWAERFLGGNQLSQQHAGGVLGGLVGGGIIQPAPVPVVMHGKADGASSPLDILERAKGQLKALRPEVERV